MTKENYSLITSALYQCLSEKGFKPSEDELDYYSNGERAFRINYDESGKLICLDSAVLQEGEGVDWKTVSSWQLDENSTERDMKSISNDFIDTVSEQLGIKATGSVTNAVDMPSKKKNSDTIDMESFTARFLAIYPSYKDAYAENVSSYSEFLYDKFFSEYAVSELKESLLSDDKKQLKKVLELYSAAFINGDNIVSTTVVYTIMSGVALDDQKATENLMRYLEKYTYLKRATECMLQLLSSQAKRKKYLH